MRLGSRRWGVLRFQMRPTRAAVFLISQPRNRRGTGVDDGQRPNAWKQRSKEAEEKEGRVKLGGGAGVESLAALDHPRAEEEKINGSCAYRSS